MNKQLLIYKKKIKMISSYNRADGWKGRILNDYAYRPIN